MAASQPQVPAASSSAGVSGPGSAGGLGTQQQPQPPTQLVGSAQGGLLQQQQQDFDPVQRYKMLIPQLKESLQVIRLELRDASGVWFSDRGGRRRCCRGKQRAGGELGKGKGGRLGLRGSSASVEPGIGQNSSGREFLKEKPGSGR